MQCTMKLRNRSDLRSAWRTIEEVNTRGSRNSVGAPATNPVLTATAASNWSTACMTRFEPSMRRFQVFLVRFHLSGAEIEFSQDAINGVDWGRGRPACLRRTGVVRLRPVLVSICPAPRTLCTPHRVWVWLVIALHRSSISRALRATWKSTVRLGVRNACEGP